MKDKNKTQVNKILLLFMAAIVVIGIAMAEEESDVSVSANAQASGDETITDTQVIITGDSASSIATSRAKAENGGSATAEATAQVTWVNVASSYAHSIATAIAGIGETIWVEATATATVSVKGDRIKASADSSATGSETYAIAETKIGDWDENKEGSENAENGEVIVKPSGRPPGMSGFIFGKGDTERYCNFKLQLSDKNPDNDERARYMMQTIAWDYGFKEDELQKYEDKFNITTTCKPGLKFQDRIP